MKSGYIWFTRNYHKKSVWSVFMGDNVELKVKHKRTIDRLVDTLLQRTVLIYKQ